MACVHASCEDGGLHICTPWIRLGLKTPSFSLCGDCGLVDFRLLSFPETADLSVWLFRRSFRLVIWPLLDSPAVTENRRGLGNCDFGMDQILVMARGNWSKIVLETWREEAELFEHLDAQSVTEITETRMSDLGLQVPEEG